MSTPLDPDERAPRTGVQSDWLRLAPASLNGALVALIGRDTSRLTLSSAQRLSHFPASPLVTVSWYHGVDAGLVLRSPDGPRWERFGARVVISGTQSQPTVSWAPTTGRGYMACFTADAARALFDLDLAAIQDRFVPAERAVGAHWAPLWAALCTCAEADIPEVLERHLAGRWQALHGRVSSQPSLRQLGRSWVERLGWQAREWSRMHSSRHVERRVRAFSGRSLREWEALVRSEGLFFAARDRYDAGQAIDWSALAQDQGFADQAHMSRTAKRITGFAPSEFARRFVEDESFWIYRLWV